MAAAYWAKLNANQRQALLDKANAALRSDKSKEDAPDISKSERLLQPLPRPKPDQQDKAEPDEKKTREQDVKESEAEKEARYKECEKKLEKLLQRCYDLYKRTGNSDKYRACKSQAMEVYTACLLKNPDKDPPYFPF